jgi:hypothetical protein
MNLSGDTDIVNIANTKGFIWKRETLMAEKRTKVNMKGN